jgi:ribosomal protein S18 acetylase RimI-like enzyme
MDDLPPRPGIRWRCISHDDLDALERLYRVWETESAIPYRMSHRDLEHELADPEVELDRDTRVAEMDDGELAASVMVWAPPRTGQKHRAFLFTVVRAAHAGLERDLIRWGVSQVERRFAARHDDLPRVVRTFAEATEHSKIRRFEGEGFAVVRFFVDMLRPLDGPIPEVVVPGGVELIPWDDPWIEPAHAAHCAAFADHWGSLPPTLDGWRHRFASPTFRGDLSHAAVVGDEVVAYVLNAVYPEDFEHRGRREGWVETLGTRPEWRKRGVATALLTASFRSFVSAGLDHAAIGVDAASETGALHLYENLGFAEHHRSVALLRELGSGPGEVVRPTQLSPGG